MISKTNLRKVLQKYIYHRNRTHYLKWVLCKEWSVRFFFTYDTRSEYRMKWVLKSHFLKEYIVLSKNEAIDYIQKYAKDVEPVEYFSLNEFKKGYRRLVVCPVSGVDVYIDRKGD